MLQVAVGLELDISTVSVLLISMKIFIVIVVVHGIYDCDMRMWVIFVVHCSVYMNVCMNLQM